MKLLNEIQQKIKAPKTQYNAHGKYHYRSCSDILSAVKPFLADGGAFLHMKDELVEISGRFYVKSTVTLRCGSESIDSTGWAREADEQKGMNAGQLSCATSSYARKLALSGLFGIDDSHDAGNGQNGKPATQAKLIEQAYADYIETADIPEHFSVPFEKFKDAVRAEARQQIPAGERKSFTWNADTIKPFIEALKLANLVVEDKPDAKSE